jgi:hypothetical protein
MRHKLFGMSISARLRLLNLQHRKDEPEIDRQLLTKHLGPSVSGPAAKTCQDGPADSRAEECPRWACGSRGVLWPWRGFTASNLKDCVAVLLHLVVAFVQAGPVDIPRHYPGLHQPLWRRPGSMGDAFCTR